MNSETTGPVTLQRDVEAIRIPSGDRLTLPAHISVVITQALGGSFTVVVPDRAGLFRISAKDADALGLERQTTDAAHDEGPLDERQVWAQLKQCYDPEIPVNIVDLGLIYSLDVKDDPNGNGKNVNVKMTLTAPGCGMGPSLAADAQQRILTVPGVTSADVELVWDPPWSPDRISAEGRERLGMV
jgi:probable FeS assembly SUF system protein SufT